MSSLLDMDPKKINDHIIVKNQGGWSFSSLFNKIQFYNYYIMTSFHGLKQLEGFMGNDIRETTVNFDVLINGQSIGQKTLATSNYSRNQTIELDVNPTLFMGNSATNITVSLRRTLTTSKVSFNQAYISIIYK